jgi:hypothetical protein
MQVSKRDSRSEPCDGEKTATVFGPMVPIKVHVVAKTRDGV